MAAAFAASFLQYYFLSVTAQIMEMRPVAMGTQSPSSRSLSLKISRAPNRGAVNSKPT